jgi:uncharacterized damage-inducible protein DinB
MQSKDLVRDNLKKSADREQVFDGPDPSSDVNDYPQFDEVLAKCRDIRQSTVALLEQLSEDDLDKTSARAPKDWEETFGTYRLCLQYVADHWYMHRGQLADARRAARVSRMWV